MFLCVSTLGIASPNHLKEGQRGKNKLTFDFLPACDWGHTQSEAASLTQCSFFISITFSYRQATNQTFIEMTRNLLSGTKVVRFKPMKVKDTF